MDTLSPLTKKMIAFAKSSVSEAQEIQGASKCIELLAANLSIENATKMSKDRKLWSSNRPSLRCQPLSGGVAIK